MNTPPIVGGDVTAPIPPDQRREAIERVTGASPAKVFGKDPGFQPPVDPIDGKTKQRVGYVYRDIPIVTIQNSWTVPGIRQALYENMYGMFSQSGQLVDAILGDDRVQATLGSRVGGLFGREIRIKPANDSAAAREVADAWAPTAEDLLTGWALTETHVYSIFQGFGHGQIVWDTSAPIWRPMPRPWHPRYEWFDWTSRKYVAISQDGNLPIIAGDGKWYAHEPFGSYRAWVRGALRAVAEPWAIRHFAIRDWAGYSEVHGAPTRKGYVPAAADPAERAMFESVIAQLGANTSMIVPRGVDKDIGYDYELVEAMSDSWQGFPGLRDHCDLAIVLAIKFQNLTTEITSGGSRAAAEVHAKGDVSQVAADNRGWRRTIHRDFARPFAYINFGDASLAPITDLDVPEPPREDYTANAEAFAKFGTSMQALATSGLKFNDPEELRKFAERSMGLRSLPVFSIGSPPADKTADAAVSTAVATHKTADAAVTKANQPPPPPKVPTIGGDK